MYSVQSNQLLQQLTQLTCGVVATVTNTRVRTSTPRNLKLHNTTTTTTTNATTSPRVTTSGSSHFAENSASSSSKFIPEESTTPLSLKTLSNAPISYKNNTLPLDSLLAAQFSKLGLKGLKTDSEFQQVVSALANKV